MEDVLLKSADDVSFAYTTTLHDIWRRLRESDDTVSDSEDSKESTTQDTSEQSK